MFKTIIICKPFQGSKADEDQVGNKTNHHHFHLVGLLLQCCSEGLAKKSYIADGLV